MGPTTQGAADRAPQSEAARTTAADDQKPLSPASWAPRCCSARDRVDVINQRADGYPAPARPQTPPTGTGSYNPNVLAARPRARNRGVDGRAL
jgi:hypothetical protein